VNLYSLFVYIEHNGDESPKKKKVTRKDGARPALFLVVVLLYVFLVLFYVFLCSLYCLFCDVPCIVCVYVCTEQLPPGGYPIAIKYISYMHIR